MVEISCLKKLNDVLGKFRVLLEEVQRLFFPAAS